MMRTGISRVSGQREFPEDLEDVMPVLDRGTGVTRKMLHVSGEASASPKLSLEIKTF